MCTVVVFGRKTVVFVENETASERAKERETEIDRDRQREREGGREMRRRRESGWHIIQYVVIWV